MFAHGMKELTICYGKPSKPHFRLTLNMHICVHPIYYGMLLTDCFVHLANLGFCQVDNAEHRSRKKYIHVEKYTCNDKH